MMKSSVDPTDLETLKAAETANEPRTPEGTNDNVETAEKAKPVSKSVTRFGAIGFVMSVLGWVCLLLSEWPALVLGAGGVVLSAMGCRRPRSNMRNLAITGIVIGGVLVLDIIIIKVVIAYLATL